MILIAVGASPGALADRLEAGSWRVELPDVSVDELHRAVEVFLAKETVEVEEPGSD